jgi:DNA-binding PadR family transcriptional regulator
LLRNVYGWFERTQRGVYRLTSLGEAALQRWPEIMHPETSEGLAWRRKHVGSTAVPGASPIALKM